MSIGNVISAGGGSSGISTDDENNLTLGMDTLPFYNGRADMFIPESALSPAVPGSPTRTEVSVLVSTLTNVRDRVLFYTGSDSSVDPVTHLYHVDNTGFIVGLKEPNTTATELTLGGTVDTDLDLYNLTSADPDAVDEGVIYQTLKPSALWIRRKSLAQWERIFDSERDWKFVQRTYGSGADFTPHLTSPSTILGVPFFETERGHVQAIARPNDFVVEPPAVDTSAIGGERFRLLIENTNGIAPVTATFNSTYVDREGYTLGAKVIPISGQLILEFEYSVGRGKWVVLHDVDADRLRNFVRDVASSGQTAQNKDMIKADVATTAWAINAPTNTVGGETFSILVAAGTPSTNNITVNGSFFRSVAGPFVIETDTYSRYNFEYIDAVYGWHVSPTL